MSEPSGRVFTCSLKPAFTLEQEIEFLTNKATNFICYLITHDKDTEEDGTPIEPHTHIYIEYNTPRKISTVSNLLNVEPNFIEVVRNKNSVLRYLTHKDNPEKYQYLDTKVSTNCDTPYSMAIKRDNLSDKQIAEYIQQGKGAELLDVVSPTRLRTIQAFLSYDLNNKTQKEIRQLRSEIKDLYKAIQEINDNTQKIYDAYTSMIEDIKQGIVTISNKWGYEFGRMADALTDLGFKTKRIK